MALYHRNLDSEVDKTSQSDTGRILVSNILEIEVVDNTTCKIDT